MDLPDAGPLRIIAVVQARMGSTRLPGKVLRTVGGIGILELLLTRLGYSELLDAVCVAIPEGEGDDSLARYCADHGWSVFRGPHHDVLRRICQAAQGQEAEVVVHLTADCPLTCPDLVDEVIREHLAEAADFTSNAMEGLFPDGLDIEVMSMEALSLANEVAVSSRDREHVTPWIIGVESPLVVHRFTEGAEHGTWRLTVDVEEDLVLIDQILKVWGPRKVLGGSGWCDLRELLRGLGDEVRSVNSAFERNFGWNQ